MRRYSTAAGFGTSITSNAANRSGSRHKSPQLVIPQHVADHARQRLRHDDRNDAIRLVFLGQLGDHRCTRSSPRRAFRPAADRSSPAAPATAETPSAAWSSRPRPAFPATDRDRGFAACRALHFQVERFAKDFGRLLGRLRRARVDGLDRLRAQLARPWRSTCCRPSSHSGMSSVPCTRRCWSYSVVPGRTIKM